MVAPYLTRSALDATDSVDSTDLRLRITDHDAPGTPCATTRLSAPLTKILTMELDGAAAAIGADADELLLAALGRTLARTIGLGVVPVDVARTDRAVLHPVELTCATERLVSADETVAAVHRALATTPHRTIRDGILRYFGSSHPAAEVFFDYLGGLGVPAESPAHLPVTGHALRLRMFRTADGVQLEWWYDGSRFDDVTVLELAEQFPFALIELTSEAAAALGR